MPTAIHQFICLPIYLWFQYSQLAIRAKLCRSHLPGIASMTVASQKNLFPELPGIPAEIMKFCYEKVVSIPVLSLVFSLFLQEKSGSRVDRKIWKVIQENSETKFHFIHRFKATVCTIWVFLKIKWDFFYHRTICWHSASSSWSPNLSTRMSRRGDRFRWVFSHFRSSKLFWLIFSLDFFR